MISFNEAYHQVLKHTRSWGVERVPLSDAAGRVLAEDIRADRDFPPFDRATMDGIAINHEAVEEGISRFRIERVARAGSPRTALGDNSNCIEIMTGAVLPEHADTVIRYEDIEIEDGTATLTATTRPDKGQNIHRKGSDGKKGEILLRSPVKITPAEVGVLATVGNDQVGVKKLPEVAIISTGDELVEVNETPLPHQIRKSNIWSLRSALEEERITAEPLHFSDDRARIIRQLKDALERKDVLIMSGGVSKGKYDFLPGVLEELGVQKVFHFVKQKPGKPYWFGIQGDSDTVIFSFPGNPVSTFANYHVYFKNWLKRSLELPVVSQQAVLNEEIKVDGGLTRFIIVKTTFEEGMLGAVPVSQGGSGDLASLTKGDGFVRLEPRSIPYGKGEVVPFIATRRTV